MNPPEYIPPPLPGPYAEPPDPAGLRPSAATVDLVRGQVQALLAASPAYHDMAHTDRKRMEDHLVKIGAYAAECVRDDWHQSERLGQRPVVRRRETTQGPVAQAQSAGSDLVAGAANQSARIIQETLHAIAFPTFVADLIRGTFNAITQASIQQMEAYMKLLENVGQTVDGYMQSNISDNQARDWLAQRYPEHITVQVDGNQPRLATADGADDHPMPNFQADLNVSLDSLDGDALEETLLPAARRKLAQQRLQLLSTLVLMGINRIVITGGKIRAAMNFHIATTDQLQQQHASDFDARVAAAGSYGFGPWSVSASMSVGYVNTSHEQSASSIQTDTTLQSEVEIHFKSDYFPIERFAPPGTVGQIQSNTAVPQENVPWSQGLPPPAQPAAQPQLLPAMPAMPAMGAVGAPGAQPALPDKPISPDAIHPVKKGDAGAAPQKGADKADGSKQSGKGDGGQQAGKAGDTKQPTKTGDTKQPDKTTAPATAPAGAGADTGA